MISRPSRLLLLVPLLLFAALVIALVLGIQRQHGQAFSFASHIGETAPSLDLPPLDIETVFANSAALHGKPYLVNFFASWCAPCHAEHEQLTLLQRAGISIIGIAFKDKPAAIAAFIRDAGNPFAFILNDADGHAGIDWGATGIPETYLVDAQGVIRFHQAGPLTDDVVQDQLLPVWREAAK